MSDIEEDVLPFAKADQEVETISILGSTGSIGQNTLDIVAQFPARFQLDLITANSSADLLVKQAQKYKPKRVVIADEAAYKNVKNQLSGLGIEVFAGRKALIEQASQPVDVTMAAIVGMQGLEPMMAALENSEALALANKEPIVCAGELLINTAIHHETMLLPVDSEHNAIFQCLSHHEADVRDVTLTASGGPFYDLSRDEMAKKSAQEAVKHPRWKMGAKISIDCATMMNKTLEIIEAHYLFNLRADQIKVLVHRQSLVHAFVEFTDGSILSQLGPSDMRVPISYALSWPDRFDYAPERLDLTKLSGLSFEQPDLEKFPLLTLGWQCIQSGRNLSDNASLVLNAANEAAVAAFMKGQIGFLDIEKVIFKSMEHFKGCQAHSLDEVIEKDIEIQSFASAYCQKI